MAAPPGILFISCRDTLDLLDPALAMQVCEDVYRMQARDTVAWPTPPGIRIDVGAPFHNHWQVRGATLTDSAVTGVRLYSYFDDGVRNTVGSPERLGYVLLCDPHTGHPLAIIDDHHSYALRSAAAPSVAARWLGPREPRVLGLVGIGVMGTNMLRCLTTLYRFEEIRCTSRRPESRERFAAEWSRKLGIAVRPCATPEEVARGADIVAGGTTSSEIMCRAEWLKPGCLFISLARRELDPAGWARMDKIVVDNWDFNMRMPVFRGMVEDGLFARAKLHAEIHEVVSGARGGRARPDERILIHTCGLVAQDVALAHVIYRRAQEAGRGLRLPAAALPESGKFGLPD